MSKGLLLINSNLRRITKAANANSRKLYAQNSGSNRQPVFNDNGGLRLPIKSSNYERGPAWRVGADRSALANLAVVV